MKKLWMAVGLAAAVGGTAYYLRARASEAATVTVDPALRVHVKRQDLVIEVVDSGKVEPLTKVEIKSKIAGQVAEVRVVEGQRVARGELLLRLDPTDYQREVARAAADVAQARNALALAELDLARKRGADAAAAVARYDVELAANTREARRIAVESAQIVLETARDRLQSTRILSPIDGTVLELGIKTGEVVTPGVQQTFEGRPLLVVGDLSELIVRTELNQIDIAQIRLDQAVSVSFDAIPGARFDARVSKSAPAAVRPKGKEVDVFPVEATLVGTSTTIRPGMTADVRFQIAVRPGVLAVPIEAVVKGEGKARVSKVVVVEGKETTEKVEVTLGAQNDRLIELTGGVREGEDLVIDPASSKANEVEL